MPQKEYKIKRDIKFRENVVAEVPFLQDIRENETCDVDDVASKNDSALNSPDMQDVVLFKRRIKLNEHIVSEVPVISPKRLLPTITIQENLSDITAGPEKKSPELDFDDIYESISKTSIDDESNIIEKDNKEDEKIDPAVVEVKFEEIIQLYAKEQTSTSLDAQKIPKQSKIPIFRQLSETGSRVLSRAPRRRSLDIKEFNATVQTELKTFDSIEKQDDQIVDKNRDGVVSYEQIQVLNNEDDKKKEPLVIEEQASKEKQVLDNDEKELHFNRRMNNISTPESKIEIQDIADVRKKGRSGIPLLKKCVTENVKQTDSVNDSSQSETNVNQDNAILTEDKTNPGTTAVEEDINNKIKMSNSKPVIVKEQIKESKASYDSNLSDDVQDKQCFVNTDPEPNDVKSKTEHQKYMEKEKYYKDMGLKPISSKIAIFEDRKKLVSKNEKISNTQHNENTRDHTSTLTLDSSQHNNNNKQDGNDLKNNAEKYDISKDVKTNEIVEKDLHGPNTNDINSDKAITEDAPTKTYKTHNVNGDKIINGHPSGLRKESALAHSSKLPVTLDPKQQELKDPKQTNEKPLPKPTYKSDKDIIKRNLTIFTQKSVEETKPNLKRAKSLVDIELGTKIHGKVEKVIKELTVDKVFEKPGGIKMKERPRRNSVSEKIALFEKKITAVLMDDQLLILDDNLKMAGAPPHLGFEKIPEPVKPLVKHETELERKQKLINRLLNVKAIMPYEKSEPMPFYKMRDGNKMPVIALGTALLLPDLTKYIVAAAIDLGYRAIDTAYIYGNERQVGEGIQMKIDDGTIKREDIFVISKLWNTYHAPDLVERACRDSLEALGLDYVDMYLIHQPMSFKEGPNPVPMVNNTMQYSEQYSYVDAWKAMIALKKKNLVRSIGVSNFNIQQLQTLINETGEAPVNNQIECHPYLTQRELSDFCAKNNIAVSAFSVLGSKGTPAEYKSRNASAVIDDPSVMLLAKRTGFSATQILLRYQLERGHCLIVKASTPEHLLMNLTCLKMKLNEEQMELLNQLNRDQRNFDFKGMGDTHKDYPFHAFE